MGGSNNALNNLFNNQLGAGQLALGQNNGLVNSMLGGLNQSGSLLNTMGGMLNQSYNPLTALAGMGSNIWQTGLSGAAQLFSGGANAATQNPWAQFNPSGGVTGFNGVVGGNGNGGH